MSQLTISSVYGRNRPMSVHGRYVKLHIAATMCSSQLCEAFGDCYRKSLLLLAW